MVLLTQHKCFLTSTLMGTWSIHRSVTSHHTCVTHINHLANKNDSEEQLWWKSRQHMSERSQPEWADSELATLWCCACNKLFSHLLESAEGDHCPKYRTKCVTQSHLTVFITLKKVDQTTFCFCPVCALCSYNRFWLVTVLESRLSSGE